MLLAVLGAGRPRLHVRVAGAGGSPVATFVVDRGFTMSARGREAPRYVEALDAARTELVDAIGRRPVLLSVVPPVDRDDAGARRTDLSGALGEVRRLAPTAADTRAALRAAVRRRLAETGEPVVVVSDQSLGIEDDRLIQIPPQTGQVRNAGIVSLAARERPVPQVMVRVGNHGVAARDVTVRVSSGGRSVERSIALPAAGEADAFVDLPALGATVEAELVGLGDDQPADDRAWLVREASWPRVEVRAPLPPGVGRIVEQYGIARPAGAGSRRVVIVGKTSEAPANEPAVIVESALAGAAPATGPSGAAIQAEAHPVTAGVDWAKELAGVGAVPAPQPTAGWR
jgi:hypothetical protein